MHNNVDGRAVSEPEGTHGRTLRVLTPSLAASWCMLSGELITAVWFLLRVAWDVRGALTVATLGALSWELGNASVWVVLMGLWIIVRRSLRDADARDARALAWIWSGAAAIFAVRALDSAVVGTRIPVAHPEPLGWCLLSLLSCVRYTAATHVTWQPMLYLTKALCDTLWMGLPATWGVTLPAHGTGKAAHDDCNSDHA